MKTLHSFCKEYKLPKTSVRRLLLEHGFSTASGLSYEAQVVALQQFKPEALEPTGDAKEPDQVVSGGALGYYSTSASSVLVSSRGLSLGNIGNRLSTREERRLSVVAGFQGVTLTREERRALIEQAALIDADDDSEVYAAVYQQRLDSNLQRHAGATVAVLGKDVDSLDEEPPTDPV